MEDTGTPARLQERHSRALTVQSHKTFAHYADLNYFLPAKKRPADVSHYLRWDNLCVSDWGEVSIIGVNEAEGNIQNCWLGE